MQLAFIGGVHQTLRTRCETMKTLIEESRTLYAAIQARCTDGPAECFVISYTSEQALRDLLAAASIVASGCTTRERAEELCRGEIPTRHWCQQQICSFRLSVRSSLERALWIVFGRNEKLMYLFGPIWRMLSTNSLHVGRAHASDASL
jgi:hypothetical protein